MKTKLNALRELSISDLIDYKDRLKTLPIDFSIEIYAVESLIKEKS